MRLALTLLIASPLLLGAATPGTVEETKHLPGFGDVTVYRPRDLASARGVVLFVSGDGGWKLGVVDMARRLDDRAIVAGLSMPAWQKRVESHAGSCWYPAGELEVAAQALEKLYALPVYVAPILVGYSSGATVVYGALAQAPSTTFRGAVSLGFCPDLEVKRKFCGTGSWKPEWDDKKKQIWLPEDPAFPGDDGTTRWVALQGLIDEVCAPAGTIAFVGKVPHSKVVTLEKVGHGFSVPRRWGSEFDHAVDGMLAKVDVLDPPPHAVRRDETFPPPEEIVAKLTALDLPLEVLWPKAVHAALVFVSGDGGWSDLDKKVSKGLASRGIAVVGWSSLRYFWQEKTPAAFSKDLARIVAALPEDLPVFAGGYSFGAETVPVVLSGAKDVALARIRGLALLAPSAYATFEVSPLEWVLSNAAKTDYPVAGAIQNAARPVLCLMPDDDHGSGCPEGGGDGYTRAVVPGGHHFGAEYGDLAARIATFIDGVVTSRSTSPS